jgi:UDP-glucose 4-epimerase
MNIEGQHVFITGGAGFIGSTLAGRIVERNRVTIFDNFARNALQYMAFRSHSNIEIIQGDVLDAAAVSKAMSGATHVVHCAAIAGIDTVTRSPVSTLRVNLLGSANVLAAAAALPRCERVVCFSTSEVFGVRAFRSAETDPCVVGPPGEPRWTYAVGKLAEEHLAIAYYTEHRLPVTVVRPFNVYGPGQVGEGAIRTFIRRALRNEPIAIHGDGTQIRAWCYIDDMVDCTLRALTAPQAIGQSFNVGNAQATTTILGLAELIIRLLGSRSTITFTKHSMPDVDLRVPDVSKAKSLLGFSAAVALEDGIRMTAQYYRKELDR